MGKADASFLFCLWPITTAQDSRKSEWSSRISRGSVGKLGTRWKRRYNTLLTHVSSWSERSFWKYTRQIRHLYNNTSRLSSNRGYVYRPVSPFERYYESKLFDAFLHFHHSRKWFVKGILWFRWIFFFLLKNYTVGIICLHTFLNLFVDRLQPNEIGMYWYT